MKKVKANDGKKYLLPNAPTWRPGFPDKPGWYPASAVCDLLELRWFDGHRFSVHLRSFNDEKMAACVSQSVASLPDIKWTDPWWPKEVQRHLRQTRLGAMGFVLTRIPAVTTLCLWVFAFALVIYGAL